MRQRAKVRRYDGPAGGWGSVKAVASILTQEEVALFGSEILLKQNKPGGFMCVSCSWAKPAKPHPFEFCENGAKATAWEITGKKVTPDFFAAHTLSELRNWSDHDLEEQGRLTTPMRYDAASDKYVPVDWDEAFREIGKELNALDPRAVIMYTSGRASLEASYMYQLFGRMYGTNNFPDSSNMCHESTSVALPDVIGVPVGTVLLADFDQTDCIFFFGHNTTTNAPRMLHPLQGAAQRGVPIVTFNPLRERGLERFTNPQNPIQMIAGGTRISTQYHQVRVGGDAAAIAGMCKAVIEADDAAKASGRARILDVAFIEQHTSGFEEFAAFCRAQSWGDLERVSGLNRSALADAANVYMASKAVIANYGMGVTQHRHGVEMVKMIVNLLLLRGNIGKPGAGISPIRGHSNVQGQRTVGISEKTKLVPLDKLKELYDFEPPRWDGLPTVDACQGIIKGDVRGFISLGGDFLRAVPERSLMEPAWARLRLSVQIATKLNRSHIVPGEITYLLPCLGRIEVDVQASGPQAVSMEEFDRLHSRLARSARSGGGGSVVRTENRCQPCQGDTSSQSETGLGCLGFRLCAGPRRDRADLSGTVQGFQSANVRARRLSPTAAGARAKMDNAKWQGELHRTEVHGNPPSDADGIYELMTMRADGQFNTTVYNEDDRFRSVYGSRHVVLMNADDMKEIGVEQGDLVTLSTECEDGVQRRLSDLQVVTYDIPRKNLAGYYPECNGLIPLTHFAEGSKVPASKSIPVRVVPQEHNRAAA